jgi:hypothetical protein
MTGSSYSTSPRIPLSATITSCQIDSSAKNLLIHTFSCGLYLVRGVQREQPSTRLLTNAPGDNCGVFLRVG